MTIPRDPTSAERLTHIMHRIEAGASMLPNADHVKACDKAVDILREEIERTGRVPGAEKGEMR